MRKCSRISGLFLCILTLCVCSCGGGSSAADPMGTGTVTLTADVTEVQLGGSCTLTATVTNQTSAGTTVPVIGEKVSFALLTANGGTLAIASDRTGSGGVATAIYTAAKDNLAADTVRVTTDVGATATITITKTGTIIGTPLISSLSASPTTVAAGQTSIITVKVTDENGIPIWWGETVTFTLPVNESGASFVNAGGVYVSSVSVNTDASGNAVAMYQAGSTSSGAAVQDTVQAVLTNGSSNAVVIIRSAGTDLSVSVAASPTSVSAGQTSIITATVTGDKKSGAAVTFSLPVNASGASFINAGGSSVSSITLTASGSGIATAIYQAGSTSSGTAVQDTVQAVLTNGANAAVILTRTATTITTYAVKIEPSDTPVTAGQVSVITATVTSGTTAPPATPVAGITVTFTLPVNNSSATLSASSAVTDGNGKAVVTYTAGAANPTLTVYDTVKAAVGSVSSTAVITRTGTGITTYAVKIEPSDTPVTAGQVSVITATVTSGTTAPLVTPVAGITVTFTLPVNNSSATLSASSAVTDGNGKAVVTYTAGAANPTLTVYDTVKAAVGSVSSTAVITRTGTGTLSIEIKAEPASLSAGQVSIITATVKSGSTAASGVTVTFTLPLNSSGATLSSATATTDGSGKAVVTYRPGTTSPTLTVSDTVQAAVGTAANTVVITRTGSATSFYSLTVDAVPLALTTATSNSVVTAIVLIGTTPISGVTVTFTVTHGGGAGSVAAPGTAITDGNGKATIIFTGAGGTTGDTDTVTASITIAGNPYSASKVITYPSATSGFSITVKAIPTTLATNASNSVVTATVTTDTGTVVSGMTVNFAVTGVIPLGTLSVASAITDGSGNAVTTFTGNGIGATGATSVVTASIVGGYTNAVIITYP